MMVSRYAFRAITPSPTVDSNGGWVTFNDYNAMVAARDILQTHFNNAQATIAALKAQVATLQAQLAARSGPTGTGSTRE